MPTILMGAHASPAAWMCRARHWNMRIAGKGERRVINSCR